MVPFWRLFGRLGNSMFQGAYLYAQARRDLIPDIYVQDEDFFKEYAKDIRHLYGQGIEPIDMVAIHYRQGDYIGNPFYVNLSETTYYEDAMMLFPDEDFLVFSDDIEAAKNFFKGDRIHFSEGLDEVSDLNRMAGCKHQIIANSSYGWWAAWLNPNPNKKVVAPSVKNWYSDGIERTKCPDKWIRL